LGARVPPGRRKKHCWATEESCKCTPQAESAPPGRARVQFIAEIGDIWTVGEVIEVVLAYVLRATTKKVVTTFFVKKSAPPEKNPGYAYA